MDKITKFALDLLFFFVTFLLYEIQILEDLNGCRVPEM